ncbi:MAG: flagellar protein FlaG [FCB group bacterium]
MVNTTQTVSVGTDVLMPSTQKTRGENVKTPAAADNNIPQKTGITNANTQKVDYTALSDKIQKSLKNENLMVQFSVDQPSKQIVMKLLDSDTKEVIRQVPPEVTLKIAKMVTNFLEGGKITNAKV